MNPINRPGPVPYYEYYLPFLLYATFPFPHLGPVHSALLVHGLNLFLPVSGVFT